MFEKLTFASQEERDDFEKYKKLKGVYLHKQVYDILLEANVGEIVTYYELSSIIRYDKNLRDKLYIYLATAEEYLRALLCTKYDVSEECKIFKGSLGLAKLNEAIFEKIDPDIEESNLYFKLELDLSDIMRICVEKGIIAISNSAQKHINNLRNHTMHHALLLFGKAKKLSDLSSNFEVLEKRINALCELLPDDYRKGFCDDILKLNGMPFKQYLTKFYLEIEDGSKEIRIKR